MADLTAQPPDFSFGVFQDHVSWQRNRQLASASILRRHRTLREGKIKGEVEVFLQETISLNVPLLTGTEQGPSSPRPPSAIPLRAAPGGSSPPQGQRAFQLSGRPRRLTRSGVPSNGRRDGGSKRPALGPAARSPHTHLRQLRTSQLGTSRKPGASGEDPPAAGGGGGGARPPSSRGKHRGGGQGRAGRPPAGTRTLPALPRRRRGGTPSAAPLPSARRSPTRGWWGRCRAPPSGRRPLAQRSPLRRRHVPSGGNGDAGGAQAVRPCLFLSGTSQSEQFTLGLGFFFP